MDESGIKNRKTLKSLSKHLKQNTNIEFYKFGILINKLIVKYWNQQKPMILTKDWKSQIINQKHLWELFKDNQKNASQTILLQKNNRIVKNPK